MVRYFTSPLGSSLNPSCLAVVKGRLMPYYKQKRCYSEKKGKDNAPAKEEEMNLKMPGFVHPENIKEEGYFTQKAKQQLEELKKKPEGPPVERPDKKI